MPETTTPTATTVGTTEVLYRIGDFIVTVREIADQIELSGKRRVFAIIHEKHEVIAGYAQQLPGAIDAADKLDAAMRNARAAARRIAN